MAGLMNLKSWKLSNLVENMIQSISLPKRSTTTAYVTLDSNPEVVLDVDDHGLNQIDQFHGAVKSWILITCGNRSSHHASTEQEVSRCQTSDIMGIPEDNENNSDYARISEYLSIGSRHNMSGHLLFDILLCLPVTTLLRFKSISKSWYALIGSSIFIASHFDHNYGKYNLLGFPYYEDGNIDAHKCCLLSEYKYEVCGDFDCGQFGPVVDNSFVSLAFSSDGIICLVYSDPQDVVLWNPALKQVKTLPKSSVSFQSHVDIVFFGFGYSAKSNEYKVLRIIVRGRNTCNNVVEVYRSQADSWRTIVEGVVLPFRLLKGPVSKNGTCFWIAYADEFNPRDRCLLSFDLNDETFGSMPLPGGNGSFNTCLDFLDDKLAYICGSDLYYDIWCLHEHGVEESWSKVWKIGPIHIPNKDDVLFPFGFSKNGEYLLLTDGKDSHGGLLHTYNMRATVNRRSHQSTRFRLYVRYNESLVSVKSANDAY